MLCGNIEDYKLSPDLMDFTGQTKNMLSNKDTRFRKLFMDLEGFGEINTFKKLLNYFISTLYQSSNGEILKIFESATET